MVNDLATRTDPRLVASRLRIVMARLTRRLRRVADQEHSPAVISVLATLAREGDLTLGELADAEGISRPAMTVLAASIERLQLMRRETDPRDGRLVRVRLTPLGERALQLSRTRRNAYFARQLKRLSPAELATLEGAAGILERLLEERP